MQPLADKIRPSKIEEVVGQKHLVGEGKILHKIVKSGQSVNMIFYGPPGVGKTTVASIIANTTNKKLYKLNATNASVKDIQEIVSNLNTLETLNGVLLYLDEIQNFNKKQQQSLLEFIENGKITLIASTTENPYHYVYKAILSRSTVFEFKMLETKDIIDGIERAIKIAESDLNKTITYEDEVLKYIAGMSNGDLRTAINGLELAIYTSGITEGRIVHITIENVKQCFQNKKMNFDNMGDSHYDVISAFQKSIRGSDPDASIHYLARLIKADDLPSICRRLLVIAAEDIGLAYPTAITIVKSCVDAAMQLGLPEARIPLAQAVLVLATAPKSNSVLTAIDSALHDIETKDVGDMPLYLKDAHYVGCEQLGRGIEYKYPHMYPNNYVEQQYLPNNIKNQKYYKPGDNKYENKIKEHKDNL